MFWKFSNIFKNYSLCTKLIKPTLNNFFRVIMNRKTTEDSTHPRISRKVTQNRTPLRTTTEKPISSKKFLFFYAF